MRYIILAIMVLISIFVTGGVFGAVSLFGLAPDLMICFMASIAIVEKTMAGMWIGVSFGLILDMLYSPALGFYAIPYAVTGAALYFISNKFRYMDRFFMPAGIAAGAFILKDALLMLLSYVMGLSLNIGFIFIRFTLLSALETGVLMFLVHMLLRWLYKVRAIKALKYDDIKFH